MKKNTIQLALSLAFAVLTFSACSKEDNNKQEQGVDQAVRFSIMEEGFGADTEITRASTEPLKPAITEFEDCEVESSVENEPAEQAATRAITTPTHYTVRIYKDGALKGEFKGIFSSSGFTPDAGTPIQIVLRRNSTYDVLCFNDDVTPVGEKLEVALAKAATARIGTQQITLGTTDDVISISAKHVGIRVRTQITAKKDIPSITATLSSTGNIPQTVTYDPANGTYQVETSAPLTAAANSSVASIEAKYTASNYGQTYAYTSTADYHYFLPKKDLAQLKLNITGGTLFREPLNGSVQPTKTSKTVDANETYLLKVKMKPSFIYLMSDGSLGKLKDTSFGGVGGTKTPIAVVIDKNKHMAVALRNAGATMWWTSSYYVGSIYTNTNTHSVDMTHPERSLTTEATSGKDETWEASYSTSAIRGDKVKGRNPDFSPFKESADYGNTISYSGTPALTWYLPSNSDFRVLYDNLGFGDRNAVITAITAHYLPASETYGWYGELMNSAFTDVGGTAMLGSYWSSTLFYHQVSATTASAAGAWMRVTVSDLRWTYFPYQNWVGVALAFVEY